MKLQKHKTRKVRGKTYSKWVTTLPPSVIRETGLRKGMNLTVTTRGKRIILKPEV